MPLELVKQRANLIERRQRRIGERIAAQFDQRFIRPHRPRVRIGMGDKKFMVRFVVNKLPRDESINFMC